VKISIITANAQPIYEQIVQQVEQAILSGELPPGKPLPSIRQLANDLELNPNTVARAYQQLERDQIVATAGRRGTFVDADALQHLVDKTDREAHHRLDGVIRTLRAQGHSDHAIRGLFKAAMNRANPGGK
jgi:DNA-binding transcriptional regulator YhcF (GntR family)